MVNATPTGVGLHRTVVQSERRKRKHIRVRRPNHWMTALVLWLAVASIFTGFMVIRGVLALVR